LGGPLPGRGESSISNAEKMLERTALSQSLGKKKVVFNTEGGCGKKTGAKEESPATGRKKPND